MNTFKLILLPLLCVIETLGQRDCGQGSDCVPYYQCKNKKIIKNGEGLVDIHLDDKNTPKQCKALEVCCAIKQKTNDTIVTSTPILNGCGYRNENGVSVRITNAGNQTQFAEFPWMTAILRKDYTNGVEVHIYNCGGSLIHPQIVLTAAHCVENKPANTLIVRAGEWDSLTEIEIFPSQNRNVSEVFIHPNFDRKSLFNDIALLYLTRPLDIAGNVQTICLPPSNIKFDQQRCFATGWGKNSFGIGGRYQSLLKKVELPVVPRDQCQNSLRTTRLSKHFELHQSFICAGGEPGKDTCTGDGGSPLVCPVPGTSNRYYQAGIVSWGIGCGDSVPAVYASVPELRNWIDQIVTQKQIDSSFFTP